MQQTKSMIFLLDKESTNRPMSNLNYGGAYGIGATIVPTSHHPTPSRHAIMSYMWFPFIFFSFRCLQSLT